MITEEILKRVFLLGYNTALNEIKHGIKGSKKIHGESSCITGMLIRLANIMEDTREKKLEKFMKGIESD